MRPLAKKDEQGDLACSLAGCRIRRVCVCGFRLNFMHRVAETGKAPAPRESDSETGLYYYRARYYDQTTGSGHRVHREERSITKTPLPRRRSYMFTIYRPE